MLQKDKFNIKTARICSAHFSEDDYCLKYKLVNYSPNKRKLKPDAIPSLHLSNATSTNLANNALNIRRTQRLKNRHLKKNLHGLIEETNM